MIDPNELARAAVEEAAGTARDSGFNKALAKLIRDVWRSAADRFEPDELGDTNLSLAFLAIESLKSRSYRRYKGDPRESPDDIWDIDGLRLRYDNHAPEFTLDRGPGGIPMRITVMKTPVADERRPNFLAMPEWRRSDSRVRYAFARRNVLALNGYHSRAPGQTDLFGLDPMPRNISDFMLLWAGDTTTALTAGWLGVPILGSVPFLATTPLWFDDDVIPGNGNLRPGDGASGPSFDQRTTPEPHITIRPRIGEREA